MNETHKLILTKPSVRSLQEKVVENNITTLIASVNNKSLKVRGWTIERDPEGYYGQGWKQRTYYGDDRNFQYQYEMYLTVTYDHASRKPGSHDLASICRTIYNRASQPSFGKWSLTLVDDKEYVVPQDGDEISSNITNDLIGYTEVELPDNFEGYFDHLYGLDAHIGRIRAALEMGIMSNWSKRFHCALIGPPGCGKSDICQTLKKALGEDAVLEFDATATTAAGAIKELSEREILPRILVVEEIEKADEKALSFLLAALDLRSEIRKTTARATIQRDTKLFAIATVNNHELFGKLQAGALASRFMNKIWFGRPNRAQLAMILTREVSSVDGDEKWIAPTLDYCDQHNITDPRAVIALCLCGRDKLVTGEYQKMLAATEQKQDIIADWTVGA